MLTGKQKRYLRSLAHNTDPIFQIGKVGINDNMTNQMDETLENRESIKTHILQNNSDDKSDLVQTLSQVINNKVVQVIGSTIVIYRGSQESKEVSLP